MKDLNVPDSENTSVDKLETLLKQNKQNHENAEFAAQAASKVCKKILEQYAGTDEIHINLSIDDLLLVLETLYDCHELRNNTEHIRRSYNMIIDRIDAPKETNSKKTKIKTQSLIFG